MHRLQSRRNKRRNRRLRRNNVWAVDFETEPLAVCRLLSTQIPILPHYAPQVKQNNATPSNVRSCPPCSWDYHALSAEVSQALNSVLASGTPIITAMQMRPMSGKTWLLRDFARKSSA